MGAAVLRRLLGGRGGEAESIGCEGGSVSSSWYGLVVRSGTDLPWKVGASERLSCVCLVRPVCVARASGRRMGCVVCWAAAGVAVSVLATADCVIRSSEFGAVCCRMAGVIESAESVDSAVPGLSQKCSKRVPVVWLSDVWKWVPAAPMKFIKL